MRKSALIVISLSIVLLTFVTLDFIAVKNKSKQVEKAEQKADLVEKVNQISQVINQANTEDSGVLAVATTSATPTIDITEPANNFETSDQTVRLKGNVSEPTATVSAKVNNKELGRVKVATSGAFEKEITLEEGLNKIVVSALGANLATASATVSGTLKALPSYVWLFLLIVILGIIGIITLIKGLGRMRKGKSNTEAPKEPQPAPTPPTQ